jgi:hypothetical protein
MKDAHFFSSIINRELSSVEFVRDYLQLRFDGPTLTAFVWPSLLDGHNERKFGEVEYRNMLCSLIGQRVIEAYLEPGTAVYLRFEDQTSLSISLKKEEAMGAEAGHFMPSLSGSGPLMEF